MYYVYIIYSPSCGRYYTGCTENIAKRVSEHNRNIMRSTKDKGPWRLIYKEVFDIKTDALKREKAIKRYKGGTAFKRLISSVPIV